MIHSTLLLQNYMQQLRKANIADPEFELDTLLRHFCPGPLYTFGIFPEHVGPELLSRLDSAVQSRLKGMPLERVLGSVVFGGVTLRIKDNVFRPYPETLDLIECTVQSLEGNCNSLRILDLGTGSGCILLSLLQQFPYASGVGIDIDENAIEAARENAELNGLQLRAAFCIDDWGKGIKEKFDVVISNPPRVATATLPFLTAPMRDYDPVLSLDGGPDGMKFYRLLAERFATLAKPEAFGLFQLSPKYAQDVEKLFRRRSFTQMEFKLGYSRLPYALTVVNRRSRGLAKWLPFCR